MDRHTLDTCECIWDKVSTAQFSHIKLIFQYVFVVTFIWKLATIPYAYNSIQFHHIYPIKHEPKIFFTQIWRILFLFLQSFPPPPKMFHVILWISRSLVSCTNVHFARIQIDYLIIFDGVFFFSSSDHFIKCYMHANMCI